MEACRDCLSSLRLSACLLVAEAIGHRIGAARHWNHERGRDGPWVALAKCSQSVDIRGVRYKVQDFKNLIGPGSDNVYQPADARLLMMTRPRERQLAGVVHRVRAAEVRGATCNSSCLATLHLAFSPPADSNLQVSDMWHH